MTLPVDKVALLALALSACFVQTVRKEWKRFVIGKRHKCFLFLAWKQTPPRTETWAGKGKSAIANAIDLPKGDAYIETQSYTQRVYSDDQFLYLRKDRDTNYMEIRWGKSLHSSTLPFLSSPPPHQDNRHPMLALSSLCC